MTPSWLGVLDDTIRLCAAVHRPDLVDRLRRKRTQLLDPALRLLVVGEPKQGKSQLINALLNAPVCPVGDDVTTRIPTLVRHADTPQAVLVTRPASGTPPVPRRLPVPVDELAAHVTGQAHHEPGVVPDHVEIGLPRTLLATGLTLVDTPAVGGPDPTCTQATLAALDLADAVVLVSDATCELSPTELDLLRHLTGACPQVLVALTKTDITPHWRRVADRNRDHLARAGLTVPLVPLSATLRLRAAETGDTTLNAESGFPDLLGHLRRAVAGKRDLLARRAVVAVSGAALRHLASPPRPEVTSAAETRLQAAQQELEQLRRCTTRWQNTLTDAMTDLMSDIEYDLRDRTRALLREVDRILDQADPAVFWDQFQHWLHENLTRAAEANLAWLLEHLEWIAEKVARVFPPHQRHRLPDPTPDLPGELQDYLGKVDTPVMEHFTANQKIFTVLRGSYGGVLMFGLVTSLAGLPLLNPVSLGAGAVFGGKSLRDENTTRLRRRQAAAKAAAQRHVDDFFLRFGKAVKDGARAVQRRLRDHFTEVTTQLQQNILEEIRQAQQAVQRETTERARRQREHQQITALQQRIQALADTLAVAGNPRLGITA
ncbi:MAG TPA: dynamin family protein [Pseudonocardiaceae bacterium]